MIKKCLTIAGSDCSGGAGIQADLKAFSANGVYGASVISSVVAENTCRVISVFNLPVSEIVAQIDAVFEDIEIDAVKLGMLPSAEIINAVADKLEQYKPKIVVCDPVLVATSGDALSFGDTVSVMKERLFKNVDLITPNISEAQALSGVEITSLDDFDRAAEIIMRENVKTLLIKGGDFDGDCVDILYSRSSKSVVFCGKRINSQNTHGTGCTLSSAIAANLAKGMDMPEAIEKAKAYVEAAIESSFTVGKGHSPVNHFYEYHIEKGKA